MPLRAWGPVPRGPPAGARGPEGRPRVARGAPPAPGRLSGGAGRSVPGLRRWWQGMLPSILSLWEDGTRAPLGGDGGLGIARGGPGRGPPGGRRRLKPPGAPRSCTFSLPRGPGPGVLPLPSRGGGTRARAGPPGGWPRRPMAGEAGARPSGVSTVDCGAAGARARDGGAHLLLEVHGCPPPFQTRTLRESSLCEVSLGGQGGEQRGWCGNAGALQRRRPAPCRRAPAQALGPGFSADPCPRAPSFALTASQASERGQFSVCGQRGRGAT